MSDMGCSHWRTPKLQAELEATRKLASRCTPEHYPRANKGMLVYSKREYESTSKEIEQVLAKRRKRKR